MWNYNKLSKTNSSLPSINYKQFISLIILLLVTSSTTQTPSAKYDCPSSCECNQDTLSARCDDVNKLIASSRAQLKNGLDLMPIKSLDLSNNQLTKLTNQLEIFVNLTEINLSHNRLTQVQKLNFPNLEKLDLSHNQITSAKLKKLPKNVVALNLAHNEITYLPVDFMKLKALRSLELAGNPLNCTCNTLHVRNWIALNHVWSDKHILCSSPAIVKGQPWLQARQNDICLEPSSTTTQRSKYNWDNYEDDNEIMMNDQPQSAPDVEYEDEEDQPENDSEEPQKDEGVEDEEVTDVFADASEKPEEEEKPEEKEKSDDDLGLDEDLMPVSPEPLHKSSTVGTDEVSKKEDDVEYDEGSGAEQVSPSSETPEEDGSGSGDGLLILPPSKDDLESSSDDDATIEPLGIFEDNTIPPAVHRDPTETKAEIAVAPSTDGEVKKASTDDNTGTYVLLGILALCLISLMVFVAMKNRQEKKRNRRHYDVERNGATELQDMDKRLLGKPLDKNGNGNGPAEQSPLMNDYPKHQEEKKLPAMAYTTFHPPEINGNEPTPAPRENEKPRQNAYENVPNVNGKTPNNGSVPKSPETDDEDFHPASEQQNGLDSLDVAHEQPKRYSPIYTQASPRSERYSPVYSPETGRVKIKLTETPKPKTPVVVTRSRSRAGEYINTPN